MSECHEKMRDDFIRIFLFVISVLTIQILKFEKPVNRMALLHF
jgi:hypothetical protein